MIYKNIFKFLYFILSFNTLFRTYIFKFPVFSTLGC